MGLRTQRRCPWASLTHVRLLGCHHVCMADPTLLAWQQAGLVSFHDCTPGRLGSRIHGVVQCAGHV